MKAGTITVWEGAVTRAPARVTFITFDGRRIGGTVQPSTVCTVEQTFYRVRDGRVVVHEVHIGAWGAGCARDRAFVFVFNNLVEACERLGINERDIDPHRYNANSRRVNAPDAPTLTLDEYLKKGNNYA